MDLPDVFPLVSEEHAAAIGYVAIRWAGLEGGLTYLVSKLLILDGPAAHAVTANLNTPALLNLITVLIELSGDEGYVTRWRELSSECERLRPIRNDAIHGEWQVSGAENLARLTKARNRLQITLSALSTDRLNQVAEEILSLTEFVVGFADACVIIGLNKLVTSLYPPGLGRPTFTAAANAKIQAPKRVRKLSSAQARALRKKGASE